MMRQTRLPKQNASNTRSDRDGAQVWISGTLDLIVRKGVGAVKIERLAREIGVSKGSFYWFFQNSDELLARSLQHWRDQLNKAVFDQVRSSSGTARTRLHGMIDVVFTSELGRYDAAIRAWAMTDLDVQLLVAEVDMERLEFLIELFDNHGLDSETARHHAHLFYRALVAESYVRAYPSKTRKGAYLKELLEFLLAAQVMCIDPASMISDAK